MALAQPKVLNFASRIRLFSSSLKESLRASPQAMEPTSATPSGFSTSPTLRGLRKCSLTLSVYSHIINSLPISSVLRNRLAVISRQPSLVSRH